MRSATDLSRAPDEGARVAHVRQHSFSAFHEALRQFFRRRSPGSLGPRSKSGLSGRARLFGRDASRRVWRRLACTAGQVFRARLGDGARQLGPRAAGVACPGSDFGTSKLGAPSPSRARANTCGASSECCGIRGTSSRAGLWIPWGERDEGQRAPPPLRSRKATTGGGPPRGAAPTPCPDPRKPGRRLYPRGWGWCCFR